MKCFSAAAYLVPLKGLDASSALGAAGGVAAARSHELPHLDRAIQTARHQVSAIRRERDRVYGVLVAVGALETLNEITVGSIPHAHALIKRASCDVLGVGRDGNSRHTVLDAEGQDVLARLDVPEAHGAVAAAGRDGAAVTREVERVDVLLVT